MIHLLIVASISDLIEPYWNVKIPAGCVGMVLYIDLIEPYWNVKFYSTPKLNAVITDLIEPYWNVKMPYKE